MKIYIDFNSKNDCCPGSQVADNGSGDSCSKECRNRAVLYLLLAGIVFISSFILGYYIPSSITRVIWLIISGTLTVLTGIAVVVVVQCTSPVINDPFLPEESNTKKSRS